MNLCNLLLTEGTTFFPFFADIDECAEDKCGQNTRCNDTDGSFTCTCLEGYTGDPLKGCTGR